MAPVIPCYASENSLLRSRREFASKPFLQRRVFRRRRRRSAPILQNSLLFSLLAGNSRPETGSLETAPSASLTSLIQLSFDIFGCSPKRARFLGLCGRVRWRGRALTR